jgi:hypothetical protein
MFVSSGDGVKDGNVKSGALSPAFNAMVVYSFLWIIKIRTFIL